MCGIVYIHNYKELANKDVLKAYESQASRGRQGFGVYDIDNRRLVKKTLEKQIIRYLQLNNSSNILFHHRMPTSTENTKKTAHPFTTGDAYGNRAIILCHNGIITNDDEMHREHKKKGIEYTSEKAGRFNDSESLLWDFSEWYYGQTETLNARGSIAFIAVETVDGEPVTVLYGRNTGSPLKMIFNDEQMRLSSENNDSASASVSPNVLYKYDIATRAITASALPLPSYSSYTYNYDSYYRGYVPQHQKQTAWTWGGYDEEDEETYWYKPAKKAKTIKKPQEIYRDALKLCNQDATRAYTYLDNTASINIETKQEYNNIIAAMIMLDEDIKKSKKGVKK